MTGTLSDERSVTSHQSLSANEMQILSSGRSRSTLKSMESMLISTSLTGIGAL